MKYKVGQKVKIRSLEWYRDNVNRYGIIECGKYEFFEPMNEYCGKVVTIKRMDDDSYRIDTDKGAFCWTDEMIEGLIEEETKFGTASNPIEPKSNANCLTRERVDEMSFDTKSEWLKHEISLPNGYIFKDENGNIINATKIVLEKKKKEVILTQEQIDTMVHESCVLFCKHCGCGVPRETCTSLGTCKGHDDYRKSIRTHFEKHKKQL